MTELNLAKHGLACSVIKVKNHNGKAIFKGKEEKSSEIPAATSMSDTNCITNRIALRCRANLTPKHNIFQCPRLQECESW